VSQVRHRSRDRGLEQDHLPENDPGGRRDKIWVLQQGRPPDMNGIEAGFL
jgi:hypothetical protein